VKLKLFIALLFLAACILALGGMTVRGTRRALGLGRRPVPLARIPRTA
jgi:hypothetical protein